MDTKLIELVLAFLQSTWAEGNIPSALINLPNLGQQHVTS